MRFRAERGTATLELAIVAPVLMLLILGILQFGLWYHAEQVTKAAAIEAARVAAAEDGHSESARSHAFDILEAGLGTTAKDANIRVSVGSDTARAQIDAQMRGLLPIPGLSSLRLTADATAYRERFRPAGDGS